MSRRRTGFFAPRADPAPGLGEVMHWTFDDGTATDVSGNGNDGILKGTTDPTLIAGKIGAGALDFQASQNQTVWRSPVIGPLRSQWSVACWCIVDQGGANTNIIQEYRNSTQGVWRLRYLPGARAYSMRVFYEDGTNKTMQGSAYPSGDHPGNNGQWYHLAFTFDNGQNILYVDGAAQDTETAGDQTRGNTIDFSLSAIQSSSSGSHTEYSNSKIDDVRAYHRTLTPAEVASLAAM